MYGSKKVIVSLVVSGCDDSEVFDFVEEALNRVALAIDPRTESSESQHVQLGNPFYGYVTSTQVNSCNAA